MAVSPMIKVDIDRFLDENVQDNFKILPDVMAALEKERDELSSQLSGGGLEEDKGSTGEDSWRTVARDTRKAISELQSLAKKCHSIKKDIATTQTEEKDQEFKMAELLPLLKDLKDVEQLRKYLLWINRAQQLSARIELMLSSTDSMEDAVKAFTELASLVEKLSTTRCLNLKEFVTSLCEQKRTELKEKLSHEFDEFLKNINWPVTKESSMKSLKLWQQKQVPFAANFRHLLAVDTAKLHTQRIPNIDDSIPLPIELLLLPLRKRFKYHFCGSRQTNSKEKPEWFFTQVSTWITDHTHFLETQIQPILSSSHQHWNAKVEFIRGLLQEIVNKLRYELDPASSPDNKCILDDDYLMSHLIDELLLFEQELHSVHQYPTLYPSCVLVLEQESILCHWLNLERQFAVEKFKVILESPTSWEPLYNDVLAVDDTRVPECAERMMQLIAGITERFKHIPSLYTRLQFLELQTDLLLEFHQDLSDNVNRVLSAPLSSRFSAYLNASHYIATLLNKWGEETFYLELHYYNKQLQSAEKKQFKKGSIEEIVHQIESLRRLDPDYAQLEGTAFENVITAFNSLCDDMCTTLVEVVAKLAKSNVTAYRRERWHNFQSVQEDLEVSQTLVNFLQKLQETLHAIKSSVTPLLLDSIFDRVCTAIDEILLHQVIYTNHFNDGGSAQLRYDMTRVVAPILSQYINRPLNSSLHKTCDAACLLDQDTAALEVLQNLSRLALNGDQDADREAQSNLKAWRIHSLNLAEISKIVGQRIL